MTRCSSRITRLNAPRTRGRTRRRASTVSAAGSSARSAVSSSVSVLAARRPRPPVELVEQLAGVDEVAVVADRERPPRAEPERRLGVLPDRRAGRRVAAVGDREVARERGDPPLVEDLADHAEVLVDHQVAGRRTPRRRPTPGRGAGARTARSRRPPAASWPRSGSTTPTTPHISGLRRRRVVPAERPWQAVVPRVPQVVDGDVERVGDPAAALLGGARRALAGELDDQPRAAGGPELVAGQPVLAGEQDERRHVARRDLARPAATGSRRTAPTAGESPTVSRSCAPTAAPDRHLGERHGEAAARDVLAALDEAAVDRLADERLEARARGPGRAPAARPRARRRRAARTRCPRGPAPGLADQQHRVALGAERRPDALRDVVEQPDDADLGRRRDRRPGRLVVQRDVAAGDRQAERDAGVGQAADRLAELPERLGPGRVAEVEAVRDAQRPGAGDRRRCGRPRRPTSRRRATGRARRPGRWRPSRRRAPWSCP